LTAAPYEGATQSVLLSAGRLADKQNRGVKVAFARNSVRAPLRQQTTLTGRNFLLKTAQRPQALIFFRCVPRRCHRRHKDFLSLPCIDCGSVRLVNDLNISTDDYTITLQQEQNEIETKLHFFYNDPALPLHFFVRIEEKGSVHDRHRSGRRR
jgi:hypothetical protein